MTGVCTLAPISGVGALPVIVRGIAIVTEHRGRVGVEARGPDGLGISPDQSAYQGEQ